MRQDPTAFHVIGRAGISDSLEDFIDGPPPPTSPPVIQAIGASNESTDTFGVLCTLPAANVGDLRIIFASAFDSVDGANIGTPAGWTTPVNAFIPYGNGALKMSYRVKQVADPDIVNVAFQDGSAADVQYAIVKAIRITGQNVVPVAATVTNVAGTGAITPANLATTTGNSLAMCFAGGETWITLSSNRGTEIFDVNPATIQAIALYSETIPTPGVAIGPIITPSNLSVFTGAVFFIVNNLP